MSDTEFSLPLDLRMHTPSRKYMGIWVGIATILVATGALFCEMHITAAPLEQTVMTAAVMILCCFIMYTSMFDTGHQKALKSPSYETTYQGYLDARKRVREEGEMDALGAFCCEYVKKELESARERILLSAGLTLAFWEGWQKGAPLQEGETPLTSRKRRALKGASRLQPLKLTSCMLLHEGIGERRQLLLNVGVARTKRIATALLPTIIGSLVTVAVTVEGMVMTPAAIVAGILRLFTVVWTGVRGYSCGVYATLEDDKNALDVKTTLLLEYLKK